MEGLNKLVELEYLNMAVNSVSKIEGVKRCESLNKLDLTLNFIDIEDLQESCENLEFCPNFTELYLTGNPCTDWPNYRKYTIAKVETLMRLDGEEISKSERLQAKTLLPKLEKELEQLALANIKKKEDIKKEGTHDENAWSRENRWNTYLEEEERKKKKLVEEKENSMFKEYHEMFDDKPKAPPPIHNKDGGVRMFNQGGYEWKFDESSDKTKISFSLFVPRFMDTSMLNVDVQPTYIRVEVKDKIT